MNRGGVLDNPVRGKASFWAQVEAGLGGWGPRAWIMLLLAGLNGIAYPLLACLWRPQELLSVSLLYRGDPVYFPLISFLSRLQFGESIVLEHLGTGITPYPFLCMLPHAFFYRLLGPAGFVVADVLAFAACFLALTGFFHLIGIRKNFASWTALLIVSGTFGWLASLMKIYLGIDRPVLLMVTWRLARPLVTETFFLLSMFYLGAILIVPGAIKNKRVWALAGFFFAALLQGSLGWALLLAYCAPLGAVYLYFKFPMERRKLFSGIIIFAVVSVITALPFFIQRIYESPDLVQRLGVITPRHLMDVWFWNPSRPWLLTALLAITIALLYLFNKDDKPGFRLQARTLGVLALMGAVAYAGAALTVLIFGKIAQPASFYERFIKLGSYIIVISGLYLAGTIWNCLTRNRQARKWVLTLGIAVPILLAALAIYCNATRAWYAARDRRHIHHGNVFSSELIQIKDFRQDFGALILELSKPEYSQAKVLGTFNRQLHFWWLAFGHRYSFLVDPYASPLTDELMERRLVLFCQQIGMSESDFNYWIQQPTFMSSWLGGHKYIATQKHSFAPLEQYSSAAQLIIQGTHIYKYNNLLPLTEQERLLDLFRQLKENKSLAMPRLDLIVLTKIPSLQTVAPAAESYELEWENKLFRLFRAKKIIEEEPAITKEAAL